AVDDLHVSFRTQLQEALEPRARMLRSLSLVAVGQEQDEAAHPLPFRFARGDELVDDDLRAVREVAELRLPQDEAARIAARQTVFESDDADLGERAVDDLELGLDRVEVRERNVASPGLAVVQLGVALAERSADGVLPRQPHRDALDQQAAERE